VSNSDVAINPSAGISKLQVSNATPQSLTVTFDVAAGAPSGERMLSVSAFDVVVSAKLSVTPRREAGACDPACRPPRSFCNEGVCEKPVRCVPRCGPPKVCVSVNPNSSQGRCEILR
jgi:hypothetical protein